MSESIIDISRRFFVEIVEPILADEFPDELAAGAFGVFGHGSEALRMDDEYSSDHHWGLRIDALFPDEVYRARGEEMREGVSARLPAEFEGHSLRQAHVAGSGFAPESRQDFLRRTIGLDHAPETYAEWLQIPEEDIIHVINGEVWRDDTDAFRKVRTTLAAYYPEPVRLRRIAHWCRYYSGMGAYALQRAILRNNEYYANITFTRAIRLAVQLAFLLERRYFPYDKWTYARFTELPRLAAPMQPLVDEAVKLSTPWERKLELLNEISDVLDAFMVADGVIQPHEPFSTSPTSGYRVLEHAYAEIIHGLPDELKPIVPIWDQIHFESFHSQFVDRIDLETWDRMILLKNE